MQPNRVAGLLCALFAASAAAEGEITLLCEGTQYIQTLVAYRNVGQEVIRVETDSLIVRLPDGDGSTSVSTAMFGDVHMNVERTPDHYRLTAQNPERYRQSFVKDGKIYRNVQITSIGGSIERHTGEFWLGAGRSLDRYPLRILFMGHCSKTEPRF